MTTTTPNAPQTIQPASAAARTDHQTMTQQAQEIADEAALVEFASLPPGQRQLTERLRGVLAETAVTGVIRYPWPLLWPLLAQLMQEQLAKYEESEHVEIGPARPLLKDSDVSVGALVARFSTLLMGFAGPPWTLQRLCEVLLEPQKQYKRAHKLALAIEKLLLVTGEVGLSQQPGAPPTLDQLTRINEPPPPTEAQAAAAAAAKQQQQGHGAARPGDAEASGLLAAALDIRGAPPQPDSSGPAGAAAAADEPTAGAAAGPAAMDAESPAASEQPSAAAVGGAAGPGADAEMPDAAAAATTAAAVERLADGGVEAAVAAPAAMDTELPTPQAAGGGSEGAPPPAGAAAAAGM